MSRNYSVAISEGNELIEAEEFFGLRTIYRMAEEESLEDAIVKSGLVDELVLTNSCFEYSGTEYRVCFYPYSFGRDERRDEL